MKPYIIKPKMIHRLIEGQIIKVKSKVKSLEIKADLALNLSVIPE